MKIVLAALDNSLAARPVLATALALADLLEAAVEAVHVQADGDVTARGAADAASVHLRTCPGPVAERLVDEGEGDDVIAVVIGARRTPGHARPLGSTALTVATALSKPVVVVPPDAPTPAALRCILVPLEGSASTSLAPRSIIELAGGAKLDVLALHVHDEDSIPAFTDQPQHEQAAWAHEFLARYCPWGIGGVRLETRVGRSEELIPLVAEESGCDLIALGWSQELAGRAPVVRAALERARVPVLLVPVVIGTTERAAPTDVTRSLVKGS
jgi:nucleotide-binding universal stress UspA family protein